MSDPSVNYDAEIKKIELQIKLKELENQSRTKKSFFTPVMATIIAATLGMFATILTTYRAKENSIAVEKQKLYNQLILVAASAEDEVAASRLLRFWVDIGYLDDPKGQIAEMSATNRVPLLKIDEQYLNQAIEFKVNTLSLIANSSESYANYKDEIDLITRDMNKLYEYKKAVGDTTALKLLGILRDPERNGIIGALEFWKQRDQLSAVFVQEYTPLITEMLDLLITNETSKLDPYRAADFETILEAYQ